MGEVIEALTGLLFLILLFVLILVPPAAMIYFFGWELLGHFTWSGFLTGFSLSLIYTYALAQLARGESR